MSRTRPTFQARKVLLISGGHFVHDVFSSFLAPFLPLLIRKFGLSMMLAGSLTVFFRLPSLFNPVIGVVSDRRDLRYLAIWAPGVTAVAMSLLGVAPSYAVACLLLTAAGFSAAAFHVLGPVMIARVSGQNLGRGMSFWMTGGELARTVGPLVAVGAVSLWRFEGTYPVMFVGVLASGLLWLQLRSTPSYSGRQGGATLGAFWKALSRVMIPLSGILVCRAFMAATLVAFLPTLMVVSGKGLWLGGASLAVLECSGTVGSLFGGTISDRVGRHAVLLGAMSISSVSMIGFLHAPGWVLFPALVVLGCSLFAASPVILALVQDHSRTHRGTANGLYMGVNFLCMAAITLLMGWLADRIGLRATFTVGGLLGLAGVPVVFLLPKSERS
jgi:FSR family fosmidomycin resistance protein-like MFS transporter